MQLLIILSCQYFNDFSDEQTSFFAIIIFKVNSVEFLSWNKDHQVRQ